MHSGQAPHSQTPCHQSRSRAHLQCLGPSAVVSAVHIHGVNVCCRHAGQHREPQHSMLDKLCLLLASACFCTCGMHIGLPLRWVECCSACLIMTQASRAPVQQCCSNCCGYLQLCGHTAGECPDQTILSEPFTCKIAAQGTCSLCMSSQAACQAVASSCFHHF
jgi:hypothetical protein